jgi:NADH-quinone oxidoreductase E subunit
MGRVVYMQSMGQSVDPGAADHPLIADQQMLQQVDEYIAAFQDKPGALIQILHRIQVAYGHLPKLAQIRVAEKLDVPLTDVYGVATFYAFFSLKPKGRHIVSVCKGTACYVKGSNRVLERLENELGIAAGDTTDDGRFSLEVVRCLGACGLGPVIMIDEDVHARVKADRLPEILGRYE